jgi:5,10-methylenetetrahydromethanopterin reductase
MKKTEFWRLLPLNGKQGKATDEARRAEDEGWAGVGVPDTQCVLPDAYVEMAYAAMATTTLRITSAVTNPYTRHPAVNASAAAGLQMESGGRFVLGIGRGDSSLAHVGRAPAPLEIFRHYLAKVYALLRGEEVPFSVESDGVPAAETSGPSATRLNWLDPDIAKVPMNVSATGPKVIEIAAVIADQITFAVGATPERLSWAIGVAKEARADAGMDPENIEFGAHLPLMVHDDRQKARQLIAGDAASYARFSAMSGKVLGPLDPETAANLVKVHSVYDMREHYTAGSAASQMASDDVIDTFSIAGPADYCAERIEQLAAVGIRRISVLRVGRGIDPELHKKADRDLVELLIPSFS